MKKLNNDRIFFTSLALWFCIVTVLGFSSSFYLPNPERNMSLYLKFHGALFSSWIVLYLIQSILISAKKVQLHIKLGVLGFVLSIIIFISGVYTSFMKMPTTVGEVGNNLAYISTFLIFVLLGIKNRKKPIKHKRYLLFATTILTSAAVARIKMFGINGNLTITYYILLFIPIMSLFVYDFIIKKKLFRVTILNTIFIFAMLYFTNLIWKTNLWFNFVHDIVKLLN